eukprot:362795-Chlamydomonas_euryale.AAC.9
MSVKREFKNGDFCLDEQKRIDTLASALPGVPWHELRRDPIQARDYHVRYTHGTDTTYAYNLNTHQWTRQ